jgi:RNA polymerase sigma-32 factor
MENTAYANDDAMISSENNPILEPKKRTKKDEGAHYHVTSDPLRMYLNEIRNHKLLTREDEVHLGNRVKRNNDEAAVNQLVVSNLRLVVKIAMDINRSWSDNLMDLIQEGNLGLMKAAQKYDPDLGIKFSYYASFWIKAYMLRYIIDNRKLVKIGTTQKQRKLFFNLAKEKNRFLREGENPDWEVIAKRMGVGVKDVVEMYQRLENDISLSAPLSENARESHESAIRDPDYEAVDDNLAKNEYRVIFEKKLNQFSKRFTDRELDILRERVLAEKPVVLQEIGDRHNISRERVRQIQKKIVENIKEWSRKEIPEFQDEFFNYLN